MANIISTNDPLYGQVNKPLTTALTSSVLYEPPTNTFINNPGGNLGELQFNASGSFKGDTALVFNPGTKNLILRGVMYAEEFRGVIDTNLSSFRISGGDYGQVLSSIGSNALGWTTIPAQENADWNAVGTVGEILNKPDLTQYATIANVNTLVGNAVTQAVANIPAPNLSAYATTTYVNDAIANVVPNVVGLATETYVNNAIANVVIPNISMNGYATETFVTNAIANIDVPNIAGVATETYVQTYVGDSLVSFQSDMVAYINARIAGVIDALNMNVDGGTASTSINTTTMILNGGGAQ